MRILVLGSSRLRTPEGEEIGLGARKQRAVVAALALTPHRPVSLDLLAELVWAGEPPRAATSSLHAYVSGLRRLLDPLSGEMPDAVTIETSDHGYRLRVPPEDVDVHAFAAVVRAAEAELAPLESQLERADDPAWPGRGAVLAAVDRLEGALDTWAGEPYADLPEHPDVLAERAALERLRALAEESRLLGLLALGEHASVLTVTEAATVRQPLREPLWLIHALALVRAGRQVEGLDALRRLRETLAEEIGVDPIPRFRALETAVLRQHPDLSRVPLPAPSTTVEGVSGSLKPHAGAGTPIGRDAERRRLAAVVEDAGAGTLSCAQLVGEPGIGKTRLVEDAVLRARDAGLEVAVGRCSHDDGAPPLWPWRDVVSTVDPTWTVPVADGESEGSARAAFELRDLLVSRVLAAAERRPLLLVLEDVHWADDATLRALAHLLARAAVGTPLAVVVTRRPHPEPAGALAVAVEALVRRDAHDLRLTGLDRPASAVLVERLVGGPVSAGLVDAWHERSGGNPLFLVELARLGAADPLEVPATVREVVTRRLVDLAPDALESLVTAAVVGRQFRSETVTAALGLEPDVVEGHLDRGRRADLLTEGPDGFAFTHALVRDAVYLSSPAHGRARRHALVAHALATDPAVRLVVPADELTSDLARHWLAAGSSHADQAWRAARRAADQARGLAAYAQALELRTAAVGAHRRASDDRSQRYDLLQELAQDAALAARWPQVEAAAFEAAALARADGAPDRVAEAASTLTRYCVWLPHGFGLVHEDVVEDLRWALADLPDDADAALVTRCQLLLALAVELYYAADAVAERRALVDAGLALARRIAEPRLLWWATRAACMACWVPELTEERAEWSEEGLVAARSAGDVPAQAVSLVTLGLYELELGHLDRWHVLSEEAARIARRERLPYVMLTVHWIEMALAGLRGEQELALERLRDLTDTVPDVAVPLQELLPTVARTLARLWDPSLPETLDEVVRLQAETGLMTEVLQVMLARCGRTAALEQMVVAGTWPESEVSSWLSVAAWCLEAEAAQAVGDVDLARRAVAVISPYAGRMAITGAVMPLGPVDGYLALAAATVGDPAATRHADRAEALATAWGLRAYLTWLSAHRLRLSV